MVASYLSARGLEVGTRADGATGLRALLEESFDVVVLDVMLPDRDGFEVLRALREKSDVPVLMLTARGDDSDRIDRKSTRLNSSHVKISYAVFCLKKKTKHNKQ